MPGGVCPEHAGPSVTVPYSRPRRWGRRRKARLMGEGRIQGNETGGDGFKLQLKFSKSRDTLSTRSHTRPLSWWLRQARGAGSAQWAELPGERTEQPCCTGRGAAGCPSRHSLTRQEKLLPTGHLWPLPLRTQPVTQALLSRNCSHFPSRLTALHVPSPSLARLLLWSVAQQWAGVQPPAFEHELWASLPQGGCSQRPARPSCERAVGIPLPSGGLPVPIPLPTGVREAAAPLQPGF